MFALDNLRFNISIRSKIIGLILFIYICLFSLSTYFFAGYIQDVEHDLGEKLIKQQVSINKERALNYFANDLSLIETGLVNNAFQGWMKTPDNPDFRANAIKAIESICSITRCQGWFIYSHGTLTGFDWQTGLEAPVKTNIVLARDEWYTKIINTGNTYYTDASVHPFTLKPYIYFDYFVREEGELLGLVGTYVDIAPTIAQILNHPSQQVSNLLIDNNGYIRADLGTENNGGSKHEKLLALVKDKYIEEFIDSDTQNQLRLLNRNGQASETIITKKIKLQSGEYFAAFMFIEELEWYSVSLLDTEILSGKIDTLPMIGISILILILLITITIYVLNTQLFCQILTIHNVVKKITDGRYDEKVPITNRDELGALAIGINKMSEEISQNLSKIKEQNHALNEAMESAKQATQAKSLFLSNMSHELRTPMNAVLGFTQIGMDAEGEEAKNEYLQKVHQAGEHLLLIINDILDFNKIESQKLTLDNRYFSLNEMVRSVLDMCYGRAQQKGLMLKVNMDKNLPQYIIGDALRIKQVLINLVSNAIKFTEAGHVQISCTLVEKGDTDIVLEFSVADTGIGMSQSQISQLYKPFSQADDSITRKYGGTGLGLAISKQLVEMMKGTLSVDSTKNKGSTFRFILKLGCEIKTNTMRLENTSPTTSNELSLEDLRKLTAGVPVLLVEDNQINQIVARKLLEPLSFNIDLAEDGLSAVDKAAANPYSIIFMDVHMPNLDGIAATQQIRQFNSKVSIIGLSADVNKSDVERALQAGMDDYVTKPIRKDNLYQVIRKHIKIQKNEY